jgi:hypothetical protein
VDNLLVIPSIILGLYAAWKKLVHLEYSSCKLYMFSLCLRSFIAIALIN